MIQTLSNRFRRPIAASLYLVFYFQLLGMISARAADADRIRSDYRPYGYSRASGVRRPDNLRATNPAVQPVMRSGAQPVRNGSPATKSFIGGPSTPESNTFKTVNADNLVNLFTGDFSYSIPLLDVGGYPVNIFYNGGIGMEQEASWVGLGWNINPGSVSRNMRGVPDDFDGTDTLLQTQQVKPNKTWGGVVGVDGEVIGIKVPKVNLSLGFSFNNYLGPALDIGAGVSVSIPIIESVTSLAD